MSKETYPPEFLKLLKSVKAKRPKTVIDHILEYGQITTEELKDRYGYNHPPRAIRDIREEGIPVRTFRVTGKDGRKIAAYKFGNPSEVRTAQLSGRTAFSSKLKTERNYSPPCSSFLRRQESSEKTCPGGTPYNASPAATMLLTGFLPSQE